MPTNLAIDDELLEQALAIGGLPSKRATVDEALREFIARRKRAKTVQSFGTFEFVAGYDHKAARKKR
jgi:Arc/MetJ family transcription regulator